MSITFRVLFIVVLAANPSTPRASYSLCDKSEILQSAVSVTSKPKSRYLIANGIRIHYLEWGKGTSTIILLHGLHDSSDTWSAIAPLLASNHRVIAPDRRGAGLSDKPVAGYDYQTLAHDVYSLVVALKLRRVYLVGHSAGAGVAMTLAATAPDKLNGLVLVDGGFWPKREEVTAAQNARPLLSAPPCEEDAASCRRREAIERGSMEYDPEKLYARVTVPVLLVLGVPPEKEAKEFAAELSNARQHVESVAKQKLKKGQMSVIEDRSHWIQRDRPKELAIVIEQFLKSG
jgi:pimeloyl-ACP methyl ester carboxylesterase